MAVRVRPPSASDVASCVSGDATTIAVSSGDDEARFSFDHCFGSQADQRQVYAELMTGPVRALFDGRNCTMIAYGQTGSGKTHSMLGLPSDPGIIRQLGAELIEKARAYQGATVTATFVQLHNESFYDLLEPGPDPNGSALKLRRSDAKGVHVQGAAEKRLASPQDLEKLLDKAEGSRRNTSDRLNVDSSRSHAIFSFSLSLPAARSGGRMVTACASLVDLAGSERHRDSGKSELRRQESITIQQSLTTLGLVISAFAARQQGGGVAQGANNIHRNSKLTHLIKDSLGGLATCVVLATVPSSAECLHETLNTLHFASRVRSVSNSPAKDARSEQPQPLQPPPQQQLQQPQPPPPPPPPQRGGGKAGPPRDERRNGPPDGRNKPSRQRGSPTAADGRGRGRGREEGSGERQPERWLAERALGITPVPSPLLWAASPDISSSMHSGYTDFTASFAGQPPVGASPLPPPAAYGPYGGPGGCNYGGAGLQTSPTSHGLAYGGSAAGDALSGTLLTDTLGGGLGGGILASAPGSVEEEVAMLRQRVQQIARAAERAENEKEQQGRAYKAELKRLDELERARAAEVERLKWEIDQSQEREASKQKVSLLQDEVRNFKSASQHKMMQARPGESHPQPPHHVTLLGASPGRLAAVAWHPLAASALVACHAKSCDVSQGQLLPPCPSPLISCQWPPAIDCRLRCPNYASETPA